MKRDLRRLTTSRIKACKPADHDMWLSDAGGWRGYGQLLLRISPRGTAQFYFRYSSEGRRTTIGLGRYSRNSAPGFLTLTQARALADKHVALLVAERGHNNSRPAPLTGIGSASPEGGNSMDSSPLRDMAPPD